MLMSWCDVSWCYRFYINLKKKTLFPIIWCFVNLVSCRYFSHSWQLRAATTALCFQLFFHVYEKSEKTLDFTEGGRKEGNTRLQHLRVAIDELQVIVEREGKRKTVLADWWWGLMHRVFSRPDMQQVCVGKTAARGKRKEGKITWDKILWERCD